jgi:hypothetical protein
MLCKSWADWSGRSRLENSLVNPGDRAQSVLPRIKTKSNVVRALKEMQNLSEEPEDWYTRKLRTVFKSLSRFVSGNSNPDIVWKRSVPNMAFEKYVWTLSAAKANFVWPPVRIQRSAAPPYWVQDSANYWKFIRITGQNKQLKSGGRWMVNSKNIIRLRDRYNSNFILKWGQKEASQFSGIGGRHSDCLKRIIGGSWKNHPSLNENWGNLINLPHPCRAVQHFEGWDYLHAMFLVPMWLRLRMVQLFVKSLISTDISELERTGEKYSVKRLDECPWQI